MATMATNSPMKQKIVSGRLTIDVTSDAIASPLV